MVEEDVIIPPRNIRNLVEKTASAVGRRPALERKILEGKASDPRFAFLLDANPYHVFYKTKVAESRQASIGSQSARQTEASNGGSGATTLEPAEVGVGDSANLGRGSVAQGNLVNLRRLEDTVSGAVLSLGRPDTAGPADVVAGVNSVAIVEPDGSDAHPPVQEVAAAVSKLKAARRKADAERPRPARPPADALYSVPDVVPMVDNLSVDVIKLSAQYAAREGPSFIEILSRKESRNPLFDFLKPVHPHYVVFQRMVEAYGAILRDRRAPLGMLSGLVDWGSREAVLRQLWLRHDWKSAKDNEDESVCEAEMSSAYTALVDIDWHGFVVLETIDIDEHDANLPAPLADPSQIPRVMAAAEAARREWEMNRGDVDMDMDVDADGDVGMDGAYSVPGSSTHRSATIVTADVDADIPSNRVRKQGSQSAVSLTGIPGSVSRDKGAIESGIGRDRAVRLASAGHGEEVLLPDGQVVPMSEATPAMRAQLIDPKYKEERLRAAEKNQRQNLAGGEEIALQLAKLNRDKPDSGVYNRGDLQGSLAGRVQVRGQYSGPVRLAQPKTSGPQLPSGKADDVDESQPTKRARIEAAVDTLTQAAAAAKVSRREDTPREPVVDADGLLLPPAPITHEGLIPEGEWVAKVGQTVGVRIKVPVHANHDWNLKGQEINMEVPLQSSVQRMKEALAKIECTKVPANKQKLHYQGVFMTNRRTLASYNIGPGAVIQFEVKERGGKKRG